MSKRTTMSNGIRWLRHLLVFPIIVTIGSGIQNNSGTDLIVGLSLIIVYLLMFVSRRLRFDDENFIIIRGKRERMIPFTKIDSIKRSARKLNSRRYWYLEYRDKDDLDKKLYFLEGNFQHGAAKELIANVIKVNPSIVVWTHPFFNKPEKKEPKSK